MIKLYWWRPAEPGKINLGDEIGARIVEAVSGRAVVRCGLAHCDMISTGSVLGFGRRVVSKRSEPIQVWGSGTLQPVKIAEPNYAYLCVRGPLTRCVVSVRPDLPVGDPGLLAPLICQKVKSAQFRWGIVPHHSQLKSRAVAEMHRNTRGSVVIDVTDPDLKSTLLTLSKCARIVSTSLHGLIFADAYGIPNAWFFPRRLHAGGSWKFLDYFTSVGRECLEPTPPPASFNLDALPSDALVQCNPAHVRALQEKIVQSFPPSLPGK